MKMILVLAAVLAMAIAAPAGEVAQVLKYENDNIGVDGYKYA